ncbi:MAG TPA: TlpA disulfide reductase family protein [Candidatus Eremiobacteraceae bacterium]|jgi:thiol-disulfide isomerase/thioredoxin
MPSAVRLGALIIVCIAVVVAALFGYVHRARLAAIWRHRVAGQLNVPLDVGEPFPALDLMSPDGRRVHYAPAPGKVTVVNVFATWCPPCQAESPAYAGFAKSASARGIAIVGIDRAETAQKVDAYRRTYDLSFPYLIDDGDKTKDVLGARAMPVTIVVDARGIVRADVAGPVTAERLDALTAQAKR